ncbi:hypothetical protein DQ237_06275 [Blastococcus sp. TF02-8]|nr:hypothetical protein DQ237_06275 [Blastococcus sp. TF02-8]
MPRREAEAAWRQVWGAVLQQASADAEELPARHEAALPGLDVGVTRGLTDRGTWTWGIHALLLDGTDVRQSWEVLATRTAGERDWTVAQSAESARARTEAALRAWARRPVRARVRCALMCRSRLANGTTAHTVGPRPGQPSRATLC